MVAAALNPHPSSHSHAVADDEDVYASVSLVEGSLNNDTKSSLVLGWNLEGKNVLVVGSNDLAASRASLALSASPKSIKIVTGGHAPSPHLSDFVSSVASSATSVSIHDRHLVPNLDLADSTTLVLSTLADHAANKRLTTLCAQRRIPINVASDAHVSDFRLAGVVQDGSVQVAVTANGVGGKEIVQKVKVLLERQLPHGLGKAAENVDKLRHTLLSHHASALNPSAFLSHLLAKSSLTTLAFLTDHEIDAIAQAFSHGEEPPVLHAKPTDADSDTDTETASVEGGDTDGLATPLTAVARSGSVQVVRVASGQGESDDELAKLPEAVYEAVVGE